MAPGDTISTLDPRHYRNTTRVTVEFVIPCTFSAAIPPRRSSFLIALRPQSVFHAVPAPREIQLTRPSFRAASRRFRLFFSKKIFSKKFRGERLELPSIRQLLRFRDERILVEGMRDRFDWEYWENLVKLGWIFFNIFFLSEKEFPVNFESPISFQ